MNKQIEALKMAIEFIERHVEADEYDWLIQACKESLAEAEKQEPVAEVDFRLEYDCGLIVDRSKVTDGQKLYTHPATWQSLSDDEINELFKYFDYETFKYERAIEAKLKEKNHA